MSKKTTTEKYIEKAVKEAKKELSGTNISNCNFAGVKFDAKAVEAICKIADALSLNAEACVENAEALKKLSYVLNASDVKIESLIKL